jgi:hypothetical protein
MGIRPRNVYIPISNKAPTTGPIARKKGIRTPLVRIILLAYVFRVIDILVIFILI